MDLTSVRLELQLRAAQLVILRAENAQENELERQWVRAPAVGLVSNIWLTGVMTKEVMVEVIILEQQNQEMAEVTQR